MGTRAANFSASGLKRQDNDLIVFKSAGAAGAFKHAFDGFNGVVAHLENHDGAFSAVSRAPLAKLQASVFHFEISPLKLLETE
jgi:predicted dithiol-disulfide oxidoreductase (DUF899 family)